MVSRVVIPHKSSSIFHTKIENYQNCTNYTLCMTGGPMADMSGPVPENNRESSDVSGTVGVDEWPPPKLALGLPGVMFSDVCLSVFV